MRYAIKLNPPKSELGSLPKETEISFLPMEKIGEDGSLRLDEVKRIEEVYNGYTYFRENDVIVAKITPCFENGKGAYCTNLLNKIGFGTTELHVVRTIQKIDGRFLAYFTISNPFRKMGEASMTGAAGQKRVPENFIKDFTMAFPELPEQIVIIKFLDRETARIDVLIEKKRRQIELLQEKRTAVISHAVTKGLDPNIPMKDSGVEWLGEIPAHWKIERNRWLFREVNERSKTGDEELLTVSHMTGITPRSEKEVYMFMAESLEDYKICNPGDLVINTMWAWMGALGITPIHGIVSPSYNVYRMRKRSGIFPKYIDYVYRTPQHIMEINRYSNGIWTSRLRLYPYEFFLMKTPVPPYEEQLRIVKYLDKEIARIDILIFKIREAIEKLKEYRTALISAAVTGKIDVREYSN